MLISEITESLIDYHIRHTQKMSCLFLSPPTYLLNIMVSTSTTATIGHMQKQFVTTIPVICHQWHSRRWVELFLVPASVLRLV